MTVRAKYAAAAIVLGLVAGAGLYVSCLLPRSGVGRPDAVDPIPEHFLGYTPPKLEGRSPRAASPGPETAREKDFADTTLLDFVDASSGEALRSVHVWSVRSRDAFVPKPRLVAYSSEEPSVAIPNAVFRDMAAASELVMARAWGYLPLLLHPMEDILSGPGAKTVALERGEVLCGRVVDPLGQPVPQAEVHAMGRYGWTIRALLASDLELVPGPRSVGDFQVAVTDANGSFFLGGLGGFPVELRAMCGGYTEVGPYQRIEGSRSDVELVLSPVRRAGVHVEDAQTGAPIATYSVDVRPEEGLRGFLLDPSSRSVDAPFTGWSPWTGDTWFTWMISKQGMSRSHVPCTIRSAGYLPQEVPLDLRTPDHLLPQVVRLVPDARCQAGTIQVRVRLRGVDVTLPCCNVRLVDERSYHEDFSLVLDAGGVGAFRAPVGLYKAKLYFGTAVFTFPDTVAGVREIEVLEDQVSHVDWEPEVGAVVVSAVLNTGEHLPGFVFDVWHGKKRVSFKTEWLLARGEECAVYKRANQLPTGMVRMVLAPGSYRFLLQPVKDPRNIPWVNVAVEAGSEQILELAEDNLIDDSAADPKAD